MRKLKVTAAIMTTASLGCAAPSHAKDVTLEYHLPAVQIGFAVSHMITSCPDAKGKGFAMDTVTLIKPVYGRGEEIKINPKGNPLIDRQVKLEYHENGTLKSFNGSSTGQGGKVVAAAIKVVTFAVTTALGVPVAPSAFALDGQTTTQPIQCKPKILALLKQKDDLETQLASLKQTLISKGSSDNLLLQITRTEAAIADTVSRLTVRPDRLFWTPDAKEPSFKGKIDQADLTIWFESVKPEILQRAFYNQGLGQILAFEVSGKFKAVEGWQATPTGSVKALVHRVPRMVTATLKPAQQFEVPKDHLAPADVAAARAAHKGTEVEETIKVPQIGSLKIIPFNGSGIFGSRAVAATFDQMGELTSIGYTSTGGADALAGVVDASVAAAMALRDDRLNDIKREVELRTQTKALEDLIEAEAKADAEAAGT